MSLVEDSGSDSDSSDPESNACFGAQLLSDPEPDSPPSLDIEEQEINASDVPLTWIPPLVLFARSPDIVPMQSAESRNGGYVTV